MKRKWVWGLSVAGAVLGLAALGGAYAFVALRSRAMLDAVYPQNPSAVRVLDAPEAVARGAHLAVVTACVGCHGKDLAGQPLGVSGSVVYAPNLTVATRRLSDAQLDRAIRRGLRPDGRSELVMPSHAYASFTDDDVASIVAYLRTLRLQGVASPPPSPGLLLRANLVAGVVKTEAAKLAAAAAAPAVGAQFEAGRHLAAIACGQCHGTDLGGGSGGQAPDLMVRGAYDRNQFHTLLRTGTPTDERDLGPMSETARQSFSHFTDQEIDAIYDYLAARDRMLSAREDRRSAR
jgi:cytochrome c553